jgi:RNA polymerase sigma-70 factor (ECF subfamily)
LGRFHQGDRAILEQIYRERFETVERAVEMLEAGDRETVIHEVFFRLLTREPLRASFRGGDLGAWLAVVSRNHAIDHLRRRNREVPLEAALPPGGADTGAEAGAEARVLVERFRKEVLPPKWLGVFEARFLRQLSQKEAAATLGLRRTTLAYQEARVRRLLRRFLLKGLP